MSTINLGRFTVTEANYRRARDAANKKPAEGRTKESVLASLRQMKPGWAIHSNAEAASWGAGVRNLEICADILGRMAEDPDALVHYKALILDLEAIVPAVEQWVSENPDYSLEFNFQLEHNGTLRAAAIVRTLLGGETRGEWILPASQGTWAEMISDKLNALAQGRTQDAQGNSSWQI
ncbi:MAG: hypothetical protein FWB71_01865 [Defluviitaleaceae bacterium]|nr:hypothetical protein [Defluviitaleaceae bacterium]